MSNMFSFITRTGNPLGGKCPGRCSYCWAQSKKGFARRFNMIKYTGEARLYDAVLDTRYGEGDFIFVCDMRDLFSPDVTRTMILRVFKWIRESPDAEFLLLSKWPTRYLHYLDDFPENAVVGATIETDRRIHISISRAPPTVYRIEAMQYVAKEIDNRIFLSSEPILDFNIEMFEWKIHKMRPWKVAVGYDNYGNKLPEPSLEKTEKLIEGLRKFTEVELKTLRKAWWEDR